MPRLSVTLRGQVTFRKEVLQHLGVKPGEKIDVELLPEGKAALRPARPKGRIGALAGFLKDKTNGARLTIEEMNKAIAEGGAEAGTAGLNE
jgi:bifunctional DNA-binding transcriptional regulator/antitoxin component of YhaV-PrlF toxin-antitoxin module